MTARLPPGFRRRPRRLRSYLLLLALVLLLPALALGAAVAASAVAAYRAAYEQRLQETARALALAVDREIGTFVATLQGLAVAQRLDPEATPADLASFHADAKGLAEALGSWIVVAGPPPDFRVALHTRLPPGAGAALGLRLPQADAPLPRVFATSRPAVGGIARGVLLPELTAFAFVPVTRDGQVVRAIGMAIDPARLTALLAAQGFPNHGFAAVVDGRGNVVGRSREHDRFVGTRASDWYLAGTDGRMAGFLRGPALDRQQVVLGFARLSAAEGWTVAVVEPASAYAESWQRPLGALALGGGLVLLAGIGAAAWLAGRLLRPVQALAADAAAIVANGPGVPATLAAMPSGVLEFESLRRDIAAAAAFLQDRADQARRSEARLRLALDAAQLGIWEVDLATGQARRSGRVVPGQAAMPLSGYTLDQFLERVAHPDDLPMLRSTVEEVVSGRRGHYRVEYRVRHARRPGWRWMESYGGAAERDRVTGIALRLAGVSRDVTERRSAEEQRRLLAREVDHRAKNVLTIVQSILRLTSSEEPRGYAAAVEARVLALARAHELLARDRWRGAWLRDVLEQELDAYRRPRAAGPRIVLVGPPVHLAADAVQPVEMVAHELATNAAKYGALSVVAGCVRVSWTLTAEGGLRLAWMERDGPPVEGVPARRGFGTRLIEASVRRQLAGSLDQRWEAAGLTCIMLLPAECLRAAARAEAE